MAFTVGTWPCTMLRTPSGKPIDNLSEGLKSFVSHLPARWQSSAMIIAAPGSRSEGLQMRVLPVTAAMGIVQRGIILESA